MSVYTIAEITIKGEAAYPTRNTRPWCPRPSPSTPPARAAITLTLTLSGQGRGCERHHRRGALAPPDFGSAQYPRSHTQLSS